eukprot:TRINITY_DN12252_c0_g1_i1.p1 TRINITY_DN12252_c0_g1~~TRINITY_DN12252_c0_g1_i1.p1  ORF type:complete len:245 (+),score=64.67 TRINITY_DN12252_c0_g1_i1:190-924(+)
MVKLSFAFWALSLNLISGTFGSPPPFVDNFRVFNSSLWIEKKGIDSPQMHPCTMFLPDPELLVFSSPAANDGLTLFLADAPCRQSPDPCTPCTASAGSLRSATEYLYGTFSVTMRGPHDADLHIPYVYAFFNVYSDTSPTTINFQFSTNDPIRQVHLTYVKDSTHDLDVPVAFDPYMSFNTYTIVWTPDQLAFVINGHDVWVVTDDIPAIPMKIDLLIRVSTPNGVYHSAQTDIQSASYSPYSS